MEPCTCDKLHEWGIGTHAHDGPVILWNLVSFHTEEAAAAYAVKLNEKTGREHFIVNMCPKDKETVTA